MHRQRTMPRPLPARPGAPLAGRLHARAGTRTRPPRAPLRETTPSRSARTRSHRRTPTGTCRTRTRPLPSGTRGARTRSPCCLHPRGAARVRTTIRTPSTPTTPTRTTATRTRQAAEKRVPSFVERVARSRAPRQAFDSPHSAPRVSLNGALALIGGALGSPAPRDPSATPGVFQQPASGRRDRSVLADGHRRVSAESADEQAPRTRDARDAVALLLRRQGRGRGRRQGRGRRHLAALEVGQLPLQVHDDALGLTALAGEILRDPRTENIRLLGSSDDEVTFFSEANDEFFLLSLPI